MMNHKEAGQFSLYNTFPLVRIESAFLCNAYNERKRKKIMSNAVASVMVEWKAAVTEARKGKDSVANILTTGCKHSFVEYPSNFHVDTYRRGGKDDIENKIVMVSLSNTRMDGKGAIGRGGCGDRLRVYAIMSWSDGN